MPKVSVIIPTYNCAQYIEQAIDSVLGQTYRDLEIIVVDDGSTDNTKAIVDEFIIRNTKILYIYQDNKGQGVARNRGIAESSGEFIAILDADDIWLPERVEEGLKIMQGTPDIGLVHSETIRIDENGAVILKPKRNKDYLSGRIFKHLLLRKAHIACPTVLLRKKCLAKVGLFDEASICRGVEDRELWLRIAREYRVVYIDKVLAYYRVHRSGTSRDSKKMLAGQSYVINKFFNGNHNLLKNRALAGIHRELADELLSEQRFAYSQREYLRSLSLWPLSLWPWLNLAKALLKYKPKYVS